MRFKVTLSLFATTLSAVAVAQTHHRLITEPVNEARLHRLAGNTRHEATSSNDQGAVAEALPLEHMQLLMRRSADAQAAADRFVQQLHDKNSPLYHHWITAEEFGRTYGAAPEDVETV